MKYLLLILVIFLSGCGQLASRNKENIAGLKSMVGELPSRYDVNDPDNTLIGAIMAHTNAINQFRVQIDTNTARIEAISELSGITHYDKNGMILGGFDINAVNRKN
jgi:hypothetical protein